MMIPTKSRRIKTLKLPKNLERQYIQSKCRDCTVVVTRMDFAKILGKFTKVKIQFETNNTSKSKQTGSSSLPSRLKANENGALPTHRSAYNAHPARKLLGNSKKTKYDEKSSPPRSPNILKESNRIKKTTGKTSIDCKISKPKNGTVKYYKIIFSNPAGKKAEMKSKITLESLLPVINSDILPSNEWSIDFFPKKGEPKDDKIYDRIAAELEDLMYNEKTKNVDSKEDKNEFPSILDILNDTSKEVSDKTSQASSNLESSDVEAMLLGESKPTPMNVDKPNTSSNAKANKKSDSALEDNPNSPSILEEPEPVEVPVLSLADKPLVISPKKEPGPDSTDVNENTNTKNKNNSKSGITQVIFKKSTTGTSSKTVICPKNMKYSVSIQGKSIELLGAPKVISSLEDLQVLLQIVDESELDSVYLMQ